MAGSSRLSHLLSDLFGIVARFAIGSGVGSHALQPPQDKLDDKTGDAHHPDGDRGPHRGYGLKHMHPVTSDKGENRQRKNSDYKQPDHLATVADGSAGRTVAG